MKKIICMVSIFALCAFGLSACIQIVTSAPQEHTNQAVGNEVPATQQTSPAMQKEVPAQQVPAQQQPQGGYTRPQFSITLEQAKAAALKAAGMTEGQVTFTKQKQDYDDGMPEYEIEFVANNMKYEFDISGVNGAVLEQEVESIFD